MTNLLGKDGEVDKLNGHSFKVPEFDLDIRASSLLIGNEIILLDIGEISLFHPINKVVAIPGPTSD